MRKYILEVAVDALDEITRRKEMVVDEITERMELVVEEVSGKMKIDVIW